MSAPRLSFDSRPVLTVVVALVGLVALVSFALSFAALADVSSWARVPSSLAWAVPVILDASVLAYSLAGLVQRSRGESAGLSWALVFLFTLVSVAANAAHALDVQGLTRTAVAVVVAVSAPLSVFLTVHTLGALVATPAGLVVEPVSAHSTALVVPVPAPVVEERSRAAEVAPKGQRPNQKRTPETVAQCLALAATGQRHQDIADHLGWSRSLVGLTVRQARKAEQQPALFAA